MPEKKMRPIPETPPPTTPPPVTPTPPAATAKPSNTIQDILSSIGIDLKSNAAFAKAAGPTTSSSQPADTSEYALRGRRYRSDMMAAYESGRTPPQPFADDPSPPPLPVAAAKASSISPVQRSYGSDRSTTPRYQRRSAYEESASDPEKSANQQAPPLPNSRNAAHYSSSSTRPPRSSNSIATANTSRLADRRSRTEQQQVQPRGQDGNTHLTATGNRGERYITRGIDPSIHRNEQRDYEDCLNNSQDSNNLDDLFSSNPHQTSSSQDKPNHSAIEVNDERNQPTNSRLFQDNSNHSDDVDMNSSDIAEMATKCGLNPAMLNFLKMAQNNGLFNSSNGMPSRNQDSPTSLGHRTPVEFAGRGTAAPSSSAPPTNPGGSRLFSSSSELPATLQQTRPAASTPQMPFNPNASDYNPADLHTETRFEGTTHAESTAGVAMNFNQSRGRSYPQANAETTYLQQQQKQHQQAEVNEDISDIFSQFIRKSPLHTDSIAAFNPSPPSQRQVLSPKVEKTTKKTIRVLPKSYTKVLSIRDQV